MDTDIRKKSAKVVSIIIFAFALLVSAVIYISSKSLGILDYLLIVSTPFVLSAIFYFVVLHHDPNASD